MTQSINAQWLNTSCCWWIFFLKLEYSIFTCYRFIHLEFFALKNTSPSSVLIQTEAYHLKYVEIWDERTKVPTYLSDRKIVANDVYAQCVLIVCFIKMCRTKLFLFTFIFLALNFYFINLSILIIFQAVGMRMTKFYRKFWFECRKNHM